MADEEEKKEKEADVVEQVSMDCGECMYLLGKVYAGGKMRPQRGRI